MTVDLKNMSKRELEKLERDVSKALEKIQKKELKKVRLEMEKLAAAHGLSLDDVISTTPARKKGPKTKSAPKFANPNDPSQTWTGKGRQPDWFKTAIAAGTSPDSMAL